jgi:hypothetical protein
MKKSVKLACHVVNSNIAISSLPTLQISLVIVALFEKRFMMVSLFLPSSQISGRIYNTVVSINYVYEKCVAARHFADIGK